MLTLKALRDDPQAVIDKLSIKNFDAKPLVDKVLELDARRRALQTESDALLAQQKQKAAEIGSLMKQGLRDQAEEAKALVASLKNKTVYKGKGAKLQRALINFFLDCNTAAGYKEVEPPVLVNRDSGFGTGQLPDKEGQMYHAEVDDFYLVPTAEVPVTNIFRDVILAADQIPQRLTAYTPCFRREAGSYGKDVRGLNRLHQFDKVEIVRVEKPEDSYKALDDMVAHVESIVNKLGLKYRILRLCGGDMSFTSAITYDFELWSAAQGRWLEISSVSNFETYQSNRLHCRYRDAEGKTQLAHTLNGSSLALPRVVAALLEDNQTPEGIIIPEILRPYTGFDRID